MFRDVMIAIGSEIRQNARPVAEIFQKLLQNESYRELSFLKEIGLCAAENDGYYNSPSGLAGFKSHLNPFFQQEECQVILDFFQGLGGSDVEDQLLLCERASSQLDRIITENQKKCQEKYRLYCAIGILSGLFLAILIA